MNMYHTKKNCFVLFLQERKVGIHVLQGETFLGLWQK